MYNGKEKNNGVHVTFSYFLCLECRDQCRNKKCLITYTYDKVCVYLINHSYVCIVTIL